MSCEKYLDLISARLDGALSTEEEHALTAHLSQCPACRAIAADMDGLHSALTQTGEVDTPPALSQAVMQKIKTERLASRRRLIRRISGLAACLVLCFGAVRIIDATYSEYNRHTADPNLPSMVRHIEPQPVALNSLDAYSLPVPATAVAPFARVLNSAESLNRFLAQLPQTDLTLVTAAYNEDFFCDNRLLALVVQEPSSSITHRITALTDERVTVLRDVPETADSDIALWLILSQISGSGPEQALTVDLITN